jgi:uncharacterized protein (TIGR03083 family)
MSGAGLGHRQAMALQREELRRTVALLRTFSAADWVAQTECPDWDVRRMYLHVLGACEAGASIRENVRQLVAARRLQRSSGGPLEASLSAVQVRDRVGIEAATLADALDETAVRTVRSRTKLPGPVRALRLKVDGPVVERWSLGYLVDTIYLRDLWMHRVDAARATGRELELTPDHDGVIVADVVAEWARRHGRPYDLTLHGPAGGQFSSVDSGEASGEVGRLELDAVAFCRTLSGRLPQTGLLATIVPF